MMSQVVGLLKEDRRPLAILMDRDTRSAKEIAAFQMRAFPTTVLVGETTAGAVLPSTLQELPSGGAVMVPGDPQGVTALSQGEVLEGVGVRPDVNAPRAGPYAAGRDPILEAGLRSVLDRLRGERRRQRL
jgi:C-terminal processing protease CtpA/Prc